ncbi:MAG: flagellar type III secretion system pore protein FliP [Kofleriaceae bacterium]
MNASAVTVALAALIPLVLLMLTSFVKVSVVLALLRNAIGTPEAPSGLVVMGISLVLTFFVMAPVAVDMINAAAAEPVPAPATTPPTTPDVEGAVRTLAGPEHQGDIDRAAKAIVPLRAFLTKHASERDRETFTATSKELGRTTKGDETWVLAPAFLATELREAFAIAVLLFVPFLVIDLVVGLGLAALGLQSSSPDRIALPLKLLLFVSIDGWRLLLDSLLRGYV